MNNDQRLNAGFSELLSLGIALILVLLIASFSYRAWSEFARQSKELANASQITDETDALLSALKDAETGQRGFLLTGEDSYLEPYQQAVLSIPVTLNTLTSATGSLTGQAQRTSALQPLVTAKMDELAETIALRRAGRLDAAIAVVRTNRGKVLMDQIRALCGEIQTAENHRLTQYTDESRASVNQLGFVATMGGAILFLLVGLAAINIQRNTVRRQRLVEELRVSEAKASESRDWLQTTLSSIGDGVIATDAQGKVVFLNPIAEQLTGWPGADAIGQQLEKIFVISNEETGATVENPVRKALREGRIVGLANHTALAARDGRKLSIDDTAAPIRDPEGKMAGVVLVFRDVSPAREVERERERSRAALTSANKDLQHFAYAASHDLREPLRTIKIFTQMLQQNAPAMNDAQREQLSFILNGTDRMEQLVNALLQYSTAGSGDDRVLAEVDAEQILDDTLNNLRAAIEESHTVVTHDPLPSVIMEPAHMAVVLQNLIGNGIKYRRDEPPKLHVSASRAGDQWIFSVADNGLGIEPEYRTSIFDLFKRLHHQNLSGSGIGLATCRRIVERYEGRIWVDSDVGRGSTFFFSLPSSALPVLPSTTGNV